MIVSSATAFCRTTTKKKSLHNVIRLSVILKRMAVVASVVCYDWCHSAHCHSDEQCSFASCHCVLHGATTHSITMLRITTLSIKGLFVTLDIIDIKHK